MYRVIRSAILNFLKKNTVAPTCALPQIEGILVDNLLAFVRSFYLKPFRSREILK